MGDLVEFPLERRLIEDRPRGGRPTGVCVRLRPSDGPDGFSAVFSAGERSGPQRASYTVAGGSVQTAGGSELAVPGRRVLIGWGP